TGETAAYGGWGRLPPVPLGRNGAAILLPFGRGNLTGRVRYYPYRKNQWMLTPFYLEAATLPYRQTLSTLG
ncbi:MAG: hypothetical protein LUC87_04825, partial [Clostridiales bacterium]|nr:hypothetical protein [Clostridiales bacterium]